jgi:hypothetical protein
VLFGDDVIDVKDEIWKDALREMAVFAALTRSLSNKLASPCIHALTVRAVKSSRRGLHEANKLGVVKICPILSIFLSGQVAEINLSSQFFDSLAKLVAHPPINESLGRVGCEPSVVWIQELI